MRSLGCRILATDASLEMVNRAKEERSNESSEIDFVNTGFPLPENHEMLSRRFDAVVAVAVLMHIPDQELFSFAFQVRTLLSNKGVFLCSFCTGRPEDTSDPRLFVDREPTEVQLVFERIGFRLLAKECNADGLNRTFSWTTLVMAFDGDLGVRPIDQIESIINRDSKSSTYKLALLRALCEIAQTSYQQVRWHSDDRVSVPLGLVAEKWLYYYWPIFEASFFLPELRTGARATALKFRSCLEQLIDLYKPAGGLDAFHATYQSGKLSGQQTQILTKALKEIADAIVIGPVQFSGGAMGNGGKVFEHLRGARIQRVTGPLDVLSAFGRVCFPSNLWREMNLVGHWIGQAIILRWAELSFDFAKKAIPVSDILARLIVCPETERSVHDIKGLYQKIPHLKCVWSNKDLRNNRFDVDHVIPFSLWHNNDLWNLLPTSPKVNNHKRDKVVSHATLCASEERVVYYWRTAMEAYPQRFQAELSRTLLRGSFHKDLWEKQALSSLFEVVELVSLQRGVERWDSEQTLVNPNMEASSHLDEERSGVVSEPLRIFPFREVTSQAFEEYLPVVADMAAGSFFDGFQTSDLNYHDHLDWLKVPTHLCRRNRFAVRVAGNSMEPLFHVGEYLVFEYHRSPRSDGEIVLATCFSSAAETGEYAIKRFRAHPENWIFESENPEYEPVVISKQELRYPILGTFVCKVSDGLT